jgi:hypothetical protein
MIIKNRKELREHLESLDSLMTEIDEAEFDRKEIIDQMVQLLASGESGIGKTPTPDFGDEWEPWLTENIDYFFEEACSIVA